MRRSIAIALGLLFTPATVFAFLEVPAAYPTIQQAVDAAGEGDVVLVAPGIYSENVLIQGKAIVLASWYLTRGDPRLVDQTVIDGAGGEHAIRIAGSVGPGTAIRGFTIRNAEDGVHASGPLEFTNNRVTDNGDGIDYESGGGWVRDCTFEDNRDDGIDLDGEVAVVIERSVIRNNGNDGIEVRLHDYTGPELPVVIQGNQISGNRGDGIQLIDGEAPSSRIFRIERNLIANNAQAAIGMMCCMDTHEDFQAASLSERIYLFHNTFVGNDHGVSGGDNAIALNNLFAHNTGIALKGMNGGSVAAYNLFFANGQDFVDSNVDAATTVSADPLLDADHRPSRHSAAIDAGTAVFEWDSEVVLNRAPGDYAGLAPDVGAFEAPPPGCGLGAELLLLVPLLWLWRLRFRPDPSARIHRSSGSPSASKGNTRRKSRFMLAITQP